ncbi:MAG: aspartate carbamoyltransferase [Clostridia bacterium]|nr:aspartate carbamoyltransferase [Clostridia bacterium]
MRHLINITDLTPDEIEDLLNLADAMRANPRDWGESQRGRILATLFFEPSTRTRLSFESAMLSLGGGVLGFSSADSSSSAKGESLQDTVRTVSCYADIIAMRHPKEGAPMAAQYTSEVPIINAGDGGHNHPTQTLTDLMTIRREHGHLGDMTIGLCGDLKFGRTVHSLILALIRYPGVRFLLISPPELRLPEYLLNTLRDQGIPFEEHQAMEEALPRLDFLYMTRVQKERFFNEADYVRLKDTYILTPEKLRLASPALRVLHPLPRVNEISTQVDADPRAIYFDQVRNGRYVRMALITRMLEDFA